MLQFVIVVFEAVHEGEVKGVFCGLRVGVSCDGDEMRGVAEGEKILVVELASGSIE